MSNSSSQSQVINMGDALRGVWRRKLLVVTTLALGVAAGAGLLMISKPAYQSEAQVIIESLSTPYEKLNSGQDTRSEPVGDRVVLSQVSVLKSQDLADRVSTALKLQDNPEFNPLLGRIGLLKKILIATGFSDDPQLMTPQQLALKHINAQLNVYPIPDSNVIGIKYQAGSGQLAADVANAIAESFVISTRETEAGSTTRARDWLSAQIKDLREKVSTSESEVERYRSEAGLLKGTGTTTLGEQQIAELNTQITLADAASTEATARANEIKSLLASKGSVDSSSDVLSSAVVQNLREQQVTASRKISELSATYLPNHPKMIAAKQELQNIDGQIRREALKVVEGLAGQSKIAAARAASLRASLEKMKGRQSDANLSDVKLKELERNAVANRALLESMLARFADANARQDLSMQPGFARIIQKASVASAPYFPKPGPIMFLTTLAGLGLGLGLAFLLEVMSAAARMNETAVEVSRAPSEAEIAVVEPPVSQIPAKWPEIRQPIIPQRQNVVEDMPVLSEPAIEVLTTIPAATSLTTVQSLVDGMVGGDNSGLSEAANTIAQKCFELRQQLSIKSFLMASIGGQGFSTSAAAVATARSIAAAKLKVVIVDIAGSSSQDALLSLPIGPGLSDLVLGEADFTKVICRDPHSNAHAVRYGLKTGVAAQAAIAEKLASIVVALSSIYDFVVLNAGEATANTAAIASTCKAAVLFAPQARHRDAASAAKVLESKGLQAVMLVQLQPTPEPFARTA
jgi:polysaccharide biosynthesis transport protein